VSRDPVNEEPLDVIGTGELVERLLLGQAAAMTAARGAAPAIAGAADVLADRFLAGGRIVLLGAGTSGRLASMQAAELPGTFGIAPDRVVARVAGATPARPAGADDAEDDATLGRDDVGALRLTGDDVVIAVAASGTTAYTLAAAEAARAAGAAVVAVVNAPGTPLADLADTAIEAVTGQEVVRGSTRMAAGSAQKLVLDTLTTAAMVRAGRVHGSFMVDVVPANAKLVRRVTDLVAEICAVDPDTAAAALERCDGRTRVAIVHLLTGLAPDEAARRAESYRTVREAVVSVH
jgi:N-acetylmuramic acid 6-phosphate etherase